MPQLTHKERSMLPFFIALVLISGSYAAHDKIFGTDFCVHVLTIDCSVGYEFKPVCLSTGGTADNRCYYSQELCRHHDAKHIHAVHDGACGTVTTPAVQATTTPSGNTPEPTKDPFGILEEIFCSKTEGVQCALHIPEPACGTNGLSYSNKCELALAHCLDKQILIAHSGLCLPAEIIG